MKHARLLRAAVLGGTAAVLLSCGDPTPLGLPSRAGGTTADLIGGLRPITGLLQCTPLPYDSVTQTIGPEGGTIQVGPHTLSIPAGALGAPVTITAVALSETVNRVRFQPEGLTFQQSASLSMSYANCNLLGLLLPKRVAYTTDLLQILYYLQSVDKPLSQTVTGRLDHFSDYAVAW
jgi:hypothetical protein